MLSTRLLHRLALVLTLLVGGAFLVPDTAMAEPDRSSVSCKKKRSKRSKRRRAKRSRRKKTAKKLSAKTIKRWQKKGWTNAKIVKKAKARGYTVTKKEKRRLKKARVRKSLIAALSAPVGRPSATLAAAPSTPKTPRFDIDAELDPNDIDFDSVPPPEGMDMRYADMHRAEAGR